MFSHWNGQTTSSFWPSIDESPKASVNNFQRSWSTLDLSRNDHKTVNLCIENFRKSMISLTHFLGVCWLLNIGQLAKKFGNAYICIVYACTVYGIYAGKRHGIEQRKRFCLGCKLHKKRIQQLILVEDLGKPKGPKNINSYQAKLLLSAMFILVYMSIGFGH